MPKNVFSRQGTKALKLRKTEVQSHRCAQCNAPHATPEALGQHMRNAHMERASYKPGSDR